MPSIPVSVPTVASVLSLTANLNDFVVWLVEREVLLGHWRCDFGTIHLPVASGVEFRCRCGGGDTTHSIFSGSVFSSSRVSPGSVLLLVHEWLCDSRLSVAAARVGCSVRTVNLFFRRFRRLVAADLRRRPVRMSGNFRVAVDEMCWRVDRESGRRVWVIGAVELSPERRLFVAELPTRSAEDIARALDGVIPPLSLLVTDRLPSYNVVAEILSLRHATVRRFRHHRFRRRSVHTNAMEGSWPSVRRFLARRRRLPLSESLAEFNWRVQNSENLWNAFMAVLSIN